MSLPEDTARAAAKAKIAEVAALLGARLIGEPEHWQDRLELAPNLHLCASGGGYSQRNRIHWHGSYPGTYRTGHLPSINTAIDRPAAAIAADLQRRLIPEAKKYCLECYQGEQAEKARKAEAAGRLGQLEEILGPAVGGYGHSNRDVHLPGLAVASYQLEDRGGYRGTWHAEIEVQNWDCLLMIARLIAEDRRVWSATQPKKDEEDAA